MQSCQPYNGNVTPHKIDATAYLVMFVLVDIKDIKVEKSILQRLKSTRVTKLMTY